MSAHDLLLAGAAPPGGSGGGLEGLLQMLPLFLGMFAIMYFLMIRPQQKQRQEREAMLRALKRGDRVVTTSGLHGTISQITEHTCVLKAGEVRLEFDRSAIGRVVEGTGERDA